MLEEHRRISGIRRIAVTTAFSVQSLTIPAVIPGRKLTVRREHERIRAPMRVRAARLSNDRILFEDAMDLAGACFMSGLGRR